MKLKNLLYLPILALLMIGCEDDEQKVTDLVQESVERGAVLRTVTTTSNVIPIAIADGETSTAEGAGLNVLLEEQDPQGGALLESVDVFISFTDGSEDEGDSSAAITEEVFVRTISRDEFTDGPFGLPRVNLVISADEMLSTLNLTPDNIFGGDVFTTRLLLKLTDGREFSSGNAGGIITAGFFNSPFRYATPVVCNLPTESFVGNYLIEELTPYVDGPTLADGSIVELRIGENDDTIRQFATTNYPDYCSSLNDFTLQFVCGEIVTPTQNSVCACSSGAGFFGPADVVENYNASDDTVFLVSFLNDVENDCGAPAVTTYRFTKQ